MLRMVASEEKYTYFGCELVILSSNFALLLSPRQAILTMNADMESSFLQFVCEKQEGNKETLCLAVMLIKGLYGNTSTTASDAVELARL